MRSARQLWGTIVVIALFAALIGCSNSVTSSSYGRLQIILIDGPSPSFDSVNVVVTKVEVHIAQADSAHGWVVVNNSKRTFDLLVLRNGANALLGDSAIPAGKYTQICLTLGDSCYATSGATKYYLSLPGGTLLKLNNNFDITANNLYLLTLDFDASKSINQISAGVYELKPVIRVVANIISGTISGVISPKAAGGTVTAFDLTDTVSTVADTSGAFKIMALPAATYSVTIVPNDTLYRDTTLTSVNVTAEQNTNLGTITLTHK